MLEPLATTSPGWDSLLWDLIDPRPGETKPGQAELGRNTQPEKSAEPERTEPREPASPPQSAESATSATSASTAERTRSAAISDAAASFRAAQSRHAIERIASSPLAGRVRTVRELAAAAAPAERATWSVTWVQSWLASRSPLARLFPEGLPKGELVELVGRRSAGRLGAALDLLAAATSAGESAALVDLGDALDPQEGVLHGIDLERLLWARPTHLKPALIAAESLLAGGFSLVVVELGLPPVAGGRGVEAHWLRLARAAREAGSLALVSAPYRVAGFAAPLALELAGARALWRGRGFEPRLLAGVDSRLDLVRGRGAIDTARDERVRAAS